MSGQTSTTSIKQSALASSNVVAMPLIWREWYLIVAGLSIFFAILAIGTIIRIGWDRFHKTEAREDWL